MSSTELSLLVLKIPQDAVSTVLHKKLVMENNDELWPSKEKPA